MIEIYSFLLSANDRLFFTDMKLSNIKELKQEIMEELDKSGLDRVAAMETAPYLLDFFSKSCGPCGTMKTVLHSFKTHQPHIGVYAIDVEKNGELAAVFGVRGVPTLAFCQGREVLYTKVGVTSEAELLHIYHSLTGSYFQETGEIPPLKIQRDMIFAALTTILILLFVFLIIIL